MDLRKMGKSPRYCYNQVFNRYRRLDTTLKRPLDHPAFSREIQESAIFDELPTNALLAGPMANCPVFAVI